MRTQRRKVDLFAALVAIVACAGWMAPCHSAEFIAVQFADLDLDKPQGTAALFNRIKSAARVVCSGYQNAAPADKARYRACIQFAMSNAVARVDNPQLTDYFASRTVPAVQTQERLASKR